MDSTLNDFFDEINKITPAKKKECVWQECFDESSGYAYYWNTTTNEVTWEMPDTYRLWKEEGSKASLNLFIPPQTSSKIQKSLKIYKIPECKDLSIQKNKNSDLNYRKKEVEVDEIRPSLERKKVMLVPSYKFESESEEDCSDNSKDSNCEGGIDTDDKISEECMDEKSETDIVAEESKSKASTELCVEIDGKTEKSRITHHNDIKKKSETEEFSLVAGYGNSDEDDEVGEVETTTNQYEKDNNTKTTDCRQFIEKERTDQQGFQVIAENIFYQRKKKINLEYTATKKSTCLSKSNNEYAGLGYNDSNKGLCCLKKKYMGFKRGGILFVNSDIFSDSNLERVDENNSICEEEKKPKSKMLQGIEETSQMLSEKLKFLSEGREPTSAVQTLFIQMQTLNAALKANSLSPKYLSNWLQNTCSELVMLEQSAAPTGWSLQWDRSNKRYFYYNRKTGENQWEYPQPNLTGTDEAMDICTTPPPPSEEIFDEQCVLPHDRSVSSVRLSIMPPPPPTISKLNSPSPPPPPYISQCDKANDKTTENKEWNRSVAEPLPPGIDFPEILKATQSAINMHSNNRSKMSDVLGQELNSFYSDIAALEGQVNVPEPSPQTSDLCEIDESEEVPKRKKRKVKIAEGLSLKKRGVSKLVEKWKNVQKHLNYGNQ